MEYVDGADLDRLVRTTGRLAPNRAAYYIAQAAAGLQHAAECGLVHRDIKPSNLLVDRDGVVKVLDLGLARLAGRGGLTERFDSNSVLGTADYISPEQALNSHEVDTRADIYSLGCTFYFLLAGQAPFKDANVTQKLLMHQVTEPTPITELRDDVPPEMAAVLTRMIAKDPADRYQSPAEVMEALADWINPPPPPPTETELPLRSFGSSSSSDSSLSGRGQITLTWPKPGLRTGVTGALTKHRPLPSPDAEDPTRSPTKRWAIYGVGALGVVVIILAAWRPWSGPALDDATADLPNLTAPVGGAATKTTPARPTRGFAFQQVDRGTSRPPVVDGELRETPTDVLLISSPDLARALAGDAEWAPVFVRDAIGAGKVRVLPYAVLMASTPYANTLVAVDETGPRALATDDCLAADKLASATPEHNLMFRGPVALRTGTTEVNSVVADLSDVSAGTVGSTLKVHSGAILIAGAPGEKNATLGAGPNPLTLDFAGRTGYLTLSSDQDSANKGWAAREYLVRARMTGFGVSPLVLSGMWGTALNLDTSENEAAGLMVQGLS